VIKIIAIFSSSSDFPESKHLPLLPPPPRPYVKNSTMEWRKDGLWPKLSTPLSFLGSNSKIVFPFSVLSPLPPPESKHKKMKRNTHQPFSFFFFGSRIDSNEGAPFPSLPFPLFPFPIGSVPSRQQTPIASGSTGSSPYRFFLPPPPPPPLFFPFFQRFKSQSEEEKEESLFATFLFFFCKDLIQDSSFPLFFFSFLSSAPIGDTKQVR